MSISLPDARELSDDILEALRLRAFRGCELGFTETEVADLLGLSRETVCRWWTAYAADGLDALPGDRTGRPSAPVGPSRTIRLAHIRTIINHHNPEDLGIPAALWTRKAVAD